jgi:hypothetical protein
LSLTLVVAAGLFMRTFVKLATRDAGFTRRGVLLVSANVDRNPVAGLERSALFERLGDAARNVPGVSSAVVSYTTPIARAGMNTKIAVPGDSKLSAVLSFRTLDEQIDAALTQERLVAALATFFGLLGLVLSSVGLYGLTAYAVASRRAEIRIRMALGATSDGVVRLMLRRIAWLVGWGVVLGACLSAWKSTFVRTLLYGLEPRDPITFAGSAVLLASVAAIAAWLPARRAARIDPMSVLRDW